MDISDSNESTFQKSNNIILSNQSNHAY